MSGSNKPVTYINPPKECDICHGPFTENIMFDGKTCYGPWANMCMTCFNTIGVGLGTGLGQQYRKNDSGDWVKIAG